MEGHEFKVTTSYPVGGQSVPPETMPMLPT